MLVVTKTIDSIPGTVDFADYLPFTFKAYSGILVGPRLWRTGDFDKSLVELSIHPERHSIVDVTLVCHSNRVSSKALFSLQNLEDDAGLPVIDIAPFPATAFPDNRIDEKRDFNVGLHDGTLYVSFGAMTKMGRVLRNGRFAFVLNEASQICGVTVSHVSSNELAMLKLCLQF